ncbi:MAG TPA: redoxin domain-containing protein [Planctomycetota bacterium]|nr:redoxin domain-containing protein [Planctomycetota bacterium]
MRRLALILAVTVIAAVARLDAATADVGAASPELSSTKSLNTPDGAAITIAGLRGKVVLVDFWATWCGPCVAAIPHMQQLHDKFASKGLVVVGHTDASSKGLEQFIADKKMTYPISIGTEIGGSWGVTGIPHVFVIDPDGVIVWHGHPGGLDESVLAEPLKRVRLTSGGAAAIAMPVFETPSKANRVAKAQAQAAAGKVGSALTTLAKLVEDGKDDERGEAVQATGALDEWIGAQRATMAEKVEAGDLYGAHAVAEATDKALSGNAASEEFATVAKTFKADPAWKVGKEFAALQAKLGQLKDPAKRAAVDKFVAKNPDGYYAEAARALVK